MLTSNEGKLHASENGIHIKIGHIKDTIEQFWVQN